MKRIWINIKTSLWFVPSIMLAAALALAAASIYLEDAFRLNLGHRWPTLFGAGPEGARALLSAVATSIITITGVVFSITILTLSLAATQYTPRLLRNFMRDRSNQLVLGFFVGTLAYALVVLRTIHADGHQAFVPSLAVFMTVILAIASMWFLIHFMHHTAKSIQPVTITSEVARETHDAIRRRYPERCEEAAPEQDVEEAAIAGGQANGGWERVPAQTTGYIQTADFEGLVNCATTCRATLRTERGIGEFIMAGEPLMMVRMDGNRRVNDALVSQVNECYSINDFRTIDQDPAFGILQLADVAEKALSPGLNDSTTALMCLDRLGTILADLASRRLGHRSHRHEGMIRVIAKEEDFSAFVGAAYDRIRRSAAGNFTILDGMVQSIHRVALASPSRTRRAILLTHLEVIANVADRTLSSLYERHEFNRRLERSMAPFADLLTVPLVLPAQKAG